MSFLVDDPRMLVAVVLEHAAGGLEMQLPDVVLTQHFFVVSPLVEDGESVFVSARRFFEVFDGQEGIAHVVRRLNH